MDNLKIIIPTCDKYIHIVEALIYTIEKYWDNRGEVIILGYKEPKYNLPPNTSFHSMGEDRGPKYWGDDLINYFKDFEDDYFINLIDDTPIIRPVGSDRINELLEHMKTNNIAKIFLTGTCVEPVRSHDYGQLDLLELKQNADSRTSIQAAILRTDFFLKYLKPKQSPWQYELQNPKNDGMTILTVKMNPTAPIIFTHLYRKDTGLTDNWFKSMKTGLLMDDGDKEIIKKILKI